MVKLQRDLPQFWLDAAAGAGQRGSPGTHSNQKT
jgi:hypothetical protein